MHSLHEHIAKDGFRLRGTAMSRVDGFSDVVFGFALTLLVVSLEVPHTFTELHNSLRGFLPFAICFAILIGIWYPHYKFFRRFGLHDNGTIALNAVLLFVVLFYVYPLKFLFTVLTTGWVDQDVSAFGSHAQMRELMILYGIGFTAIYWLFGALYANAWRQRKILDLNPIELFLTRSSMLEYAFMGSVGLISALIAASNLMAHAGLAGYFYFILWPISALLSHWERRKLKRLRQTHP